MRAIHYNCRMTYVTPYGHRRTASLPTLAHTPDEAGRIAERLLRGDKRRRVAHIDDCQVIRAWL
jgi:hypothetical protein